MSKVEVVLQQCSTALSRTPASEVVSREDTPTDQRVLAAFLYHAGLSYREIDPFVDCSYEAIRQWYHRLRELFEPDRQQRDVIAVDETELEIDGEAVWVWAAVDIDSFEVLHVDVSPGQSSLEAYLFLHEVLKYCRGQPVVKGRPRAVVRLGAR